VKLTSNACSLDRLMQAACDYAIKYTHEREQFGQKVAEFQLMQGKIAGASLALPLSISCRDADAGATEQTCTRRCRLPGHTCTLWDARVMRARSAGE